MSLFGFGSSSHRITFDFEDAFDKPHTQRFEAVRSDSKEILPLYHSNDKIVGRVSVILNPGKKIEHVGIRLELVGLIESFYDRTNHYEFTSTVRELASPGILAESKVFNFEFGSGERQHESYNGINARLRYVLRLTILRSFSTNIVKEQDIWIQNTSTEPEINNSIKMEVGIEDCLHIEFEYNRSKFHLKDIVVGKVYFLLVRIKIKHMEVGIIKRESTGSGANVFNESETLAKYEIMDGAPVRGESIPIRLYLSAYNMTPTFRNVGSRFSVRYYLNLVIIDEDDRRYFKQQEINMWRREMTPYIAIAQ